jgi:hypothetical protein
MANHIIRQYHKIDSAPFQMGFNMKIIAGPKLQTKYGWLCTLLKWTKSTSHDLTTQNVWPTPETSNNQEINTMPMHEKTVGNRYQFLGKYQRDNKRKTMA